MGCNFCKYRRIISKEDTTDTTENCRLSPATSCGSFSSPDLKTWEPFPLPDVTASKKEEEETIKYHSKKDAYIVACDQINRKLHACLVPLDGVDMKRRKKTHILMEIWKRTDLVLDPKICTKAGVYRVAYSFSEASDLLNRSFSAPVSGPALFVVQQFPEEIELISVFLYPRVRPLSVEIVVHSENFPERVILLPPSLDMVDKVFQILMESHPKSIWKRDVVRTVPLIVSDLV
jgi:hypothetical protein